MIFLLYQIAHKVQKVKIFKKNLPTLKSFQKKCKKYMINSLKIILMNQNLIIHILKITPIIQYLKHQVKPIYHNKKFNDLIKKI